MKGLLIVLLVALGGCHAFSESLEEKNRCLDRNDLMHVQQDYIGAAHTLFLSITASKELVEAAKTKEADPQRFANSLNTYRHLQEAIVEGRAAEGVR